MRTHADRPGFPFLGNDFFAECGDVFSCHVIDNPDPASQVESSACGLKLLLYAAFSYSYSYCTRP